MVNSPYLLSTPQTTIFLFEGTVFSEKQITVFAISNIHTDVDSSLRFYFRHVLIQTLIRK